MRPFEDELFEVVFEGLDKATALHLRADVLGPSFTVPSIPLDFDDTHVQSLDIGADVTLEDVHVRFLRYEGRLHDVELNFVPRDAKVRSSTAWPEALHAYAVALSEKHGVGQYFGGMDPASDHATRFFTGSQRGPLFR